MSVYSFNCTFVWCNYSTTQTEMIRALKYWRFWINVSVDIMHIVNYFYCNLCCKKWSQLSSLTQCKKDRIFPGSRPISRLWLDYTTTTSVFSSLRWCYLFLEKRSADLANTSFIQTQYLRAHTAFISRWGSLIYTVLQIEAEYCSHAQTASPTASVLMFLSLETFCPGNIPCLHFLSEHLSSHEPFLCRLLSSCPRLPSQSESWEPFLPQRAARKLIGWWL